MLKPVTILLIDREIWPSEDRRLNVEIKLANNQSNKNTIIKLGAKACASDCIVNFHITIINRTNKEIDYNNWLTKYSMIY